MRHEDDLQFAILGPLEVHFCRRPVPIRGSRERLVLASLLIAAGDPVSLDRLVETVWDARPPRAAAKAVRNSVSALRQRLAEVIGPVPLIGTEPTGYRLQLDRCYLDAQDFQDKTTTARRAAAAGQAGQAAAELRAALALWRGPALAGLDGAVIEAEAASLDEQRLTALEECFDLELALGAHGRLVSELGAVAREHPLRERFAGQLMIALYRSGRQAEALDVYRQLASKLADDLGIDPSAEVAMLHQAILRQDPSLDVSVPAPAGRPQAARYRPALHSTAEDDGQALVSGTAQENDVLETPAYSSLDRRRRSGGRRVGLWAACALVAIAIGSAYLLWPSAAPSGHEANPAGTVSAARDNTDPYADHCTADRKAIDWEPVYWPSRKLFGSLVLYYSPACQAAWGYLYAPNSTAWTIHIIPDRPSGDVSIPWQFSGNTGNGSWSNVLSTRPGCVYIEAFVSSMAGTGPRAITPCFTGTVQETHT
jgi:DNA-binding SARP family transcriptional activator